MATISDKQERLLAYARKRGARCQVGNHFWFGRPALKGPRPTFLPAFLPALLVGLLTVASLLGQLPLSVSEGSTGWQVETVDSGGWVGSNTSLAVDRNGHPHITYYAVPSGTDSNRGLKYAYRDGTGWHVEMVDTDAIPNLPNSADGWRQNCLVMDSLGIPHVAYFDSENRRFNYARRTGPAQWVREVIAQSAHYDANVSMALDGQDRSRVSMGDGDGLRYAYRDAGGWHSATVDPVQAQVSTSLAVDADGRPHISYYAGGLLGNARGLRYARHDGTRWYTETVQFGAFTGTYNSLALDRANRAHIAYYDDGLNYAWLTPTGWDYSAVDGNVNAGRFASLKLDTGDHPHIGYCVCVNSTCISSWLSYAHQGSAGWETETVTPSLYNEGAYSSLGVVGGPGGGVHISHYDRLAKDLKYAFLAIPWTPTSSAYLPFVTKNAP